MIAAPWSRGDGARLGPATCVACAVLLLAAPAQGAGADDDSQQALFRRIEAWKRSFAR